MTMSASFDDPSSPTHEALDRSCQEVALGLEVATERVNRLLSTAFEDRLRAEIGLKACLKGVGVAGTLDILDGKSWLPRSHYFGVMRGGFFARGERERANQALQELPEAIREREVLGQKRDDLTNTRRSLMERAAAREPFVPDAGRGGNSAGRRRTR